MYYGGCGNGKLNDFHNCSKILDFHLFADDADLFYKHNNIDILESNLNNELSRVDSWLCANKLAINIDKSNFVLFHPDQRKIKRSNQILLQAISTY